MVDITLKEHETYNPVYPISYEAAEHLYQFLRLFWSDRLGSDLGEEKIKGLMATYHESMMKPHLRPIQQAIMAHHQRRTEAGETLSILELGCANGSTLHFLKHVAGLDGIRYVGIEPWILFIEDFQRHFPEMTIIEGDVDDLIEKDLSDLGGERFDLFIASKVFCMIEPERVRRAILKLADLCDTILLHDNLLNLTGNISSTEAVMFPYLPENVQFYFANPFMVFFEEAGFKVTTLVEIPHEDGKRGHMLIQAERA